MREQKDVGKGNRKLDVCMTCLQWDRQVAPRAKGFIQDYKQRFSAIAPTFFDRWDNEVLLGLEDHSIVQCTSSVLRKFWKYAETEYLTLHPVFPGGEGLALEE